MFDVKKNNLFEVFDPYQKFMDDEQSGTDHPSRWFVLELLKKIEFKSILDVPVGTGVDYLIFKKAGLLEGKRFVGLDFTQKFLDFCSKEKGIDCVQGDIRELPFKDGEFDVVHARGIFEHLDGDEYKKAIAECLRIAKDYAFLIFYRGAGQTKGKIYNVLGFCEQDYLQTEIEAELPAGKFERFEITDKWNAVYTIYLITK
jgi:ubiquinone/menaquinone biosynthesis C-methylase UbiE